MSKNVTFCFDFGSPYSYLAYNNLSALKDAGASVEILPVLLGGIFKATGNQPPASVPKKGEYMFKDITRWSKKLDIPFKMNPYFPILTVPHMRGAVLAKKEGLLEKYMETMFESIWVKAMNNAKGKFVVLEKLPLTPTTKSRIANRVVKYNKTFETYRFKSKSIDDYIYFFGAKA